MIPDAHLRWQCVASMLDSQSKKRRTEAHPGQAGPGLPHSLPVAKAKLTGDSR
jgi:hypothetical protein